MVLTITQETFDEAVQENINDLGLSPEEAVNEAINQFKSQGVDLGNINTRLSLLNPENIRNYIEKLTNQSDEATVLETLSLLKQELDQGIDNRVIAGKLGAYDAILDIFMKYDNNAIKIEALKAMISLKTKQPDLLDERGRCIILTNLSKTNNKDIQKLCLKWCRECCIMHETNRQQFIESNIIKNLNELLNDETVQENLKEILNVLRALILDDDVRVEFGRAHEHARIIATETLETVTQYLNRFKTDEVLINELLITLSSLLVRAEFCKQVEDAGILDCLHDIMRDYVQNEKINRQCFKLLKALSGNDQSKQNIIKKGFAPIIVNSMEAHKRNAQTAAAGLGCISALALRNPDNSKALFDASIPDIIIEIMKLHPNDKLIQKTASWAIRNMVSRSRYQNEHFLELGVEELLKQNLKNFQQFEYDTKAALRDLGCCVDLKEEWTGKGGKLTSGLIQEN